MTVPITHMHTITSFCTNHTLNHDAEFICLHGLHVVVEEAGVFARVLSLRLVQSQSTALKRQHTGST